MRPEELSNIPLEVEKLFYELQDRIMSDVVRRMQKTGGITSTADYQLNRYEVIGNSTEFIEAEIKRLTGMTDAQLWKVYDEVVEKDYTRNKKLYEQLNAQFIPPEENIWLKSLGNAVVVQTAGEITNITGSLGFSLDYGKGKKVFTPLSEYYQKYLDNACMDIASGAFDYNSVLRRVVKQMTSSGLQYVDYASGYRSKAPVAARRAVMTGVHQLSNQINEHVAKELDTDDYEVTAHYGARTEHSYWQGGIYSHKELQTVCGLGSVTGLCGANCRHSYYPFVKGISTPSYTQEELEAMRQKDEEVHTFKGKGYNAYEASQKQRHYETTMRAQRARVKHLKNGKAEQDDILAAQTRYLQTLHEYQQFSKAMKVPTQMERVYMDGLGRIAPGRRSVFKLSDSTDKWAKEAKRELLKSEKSLAHRSKESMEIYGPDGKYITTRRGGADSVRLSPLDYPKLKGAVVTHNHPSDGSFSYNDIRFLKNMPISELRVSTSDGVYYIRKPRKWPNDIKSSEQLESAIKKIRKELRPKYEQLYNEGKLTKIQRHKMYSAEVNKTFAERYGLEYGREAYE